MRRSRLTVAAAVALAAIAGRASTRAEPPADLVTDRPDQTESAVAVPEGTWQLELGVVRTDDRSGGVDVAITEGPGTLLRWGFRRRAELRLAWGGRVDVDLDRRGRGGSIDGVSDPEAGLKWELLPSGGEHELALLGHLSLPVGDDEVGSPRTDPAVRLLGAHALGEGASLGWNLGWEAASFEDGSGRAHTLGRWVYTAALGVDLAPRWGAFVELFGDLPASDPAPAAHSIDGGVTFLVRPTVQLDLAIGFGLDDDAPDRFVGVGLSFRRPR